MAGWLTTFSRSRAVHINRTDYFGLFGFFKMLYNEPWMTQRAGRYLGRFALVQSPLALYYYIRFTPDNRKWWQDRAIVKRKEKFLRNNGQI